MTSILDLENSNLPIDYFTSVLPRAQYGDESAATVSVDGSKSFFGLQDHNDPKIGPVFSGSSTHDTDNLIKSPDTSVQIDEGNVAPVQTLFTNQLLIGLKGRLNADASLKISALRSATALQKYKEIQNSNDPDFANQVLAHFGIKPNVDSRTSVFIGVMIKLCVLILKLILTSSTVVNLILRLLVLVICLPVVSSLLLLTV